MRARSLWPFVPIIVAALVVTPEVSAGSLTYSHNSSALPGVPGPAITLLSITGTNDGTNFSFTLTFANPTIEGPSSGNNDAVYGFINLDTDNNHATGVTGAFMDSSGFEPGFGQFSAVSQGFEAYINLSSEGDPLHGRPGLVDLVTTNGFNPIDTIAATYTNQAGSTPSTLFLSIPLVDFSANQISLLDAGNFSVIVGNVKNATDFLPSAAAVPEPASLGLLAAGVFFSVLLSRQITAEKGKTRRN